MVKVLAERPLHTFTRTTGGLRHREQAYDRQARWRYRQKDTFTATNCSESTRVRGCVARTCMAAQDKVATVMQIAAQRTTSGEPGRC